MGDFYLERLFGQNLLDNDCTNPITTTTEWNEWYRYKAPYDYTPVSPTMPWEITRNYIDIYEEKPKKEKNMKHLYHVIVVNLEEEILVDAKKVAENEDDAKFLAGVFSTLENENLKPTDVTIIVNSLGSVKVKPKVKEVKVKKEE